MALETNILYNIPMYLGSLVDITAKQTDSALAPGSFYMTNDSGQPVKLFLSLSANQLSRVDNETFTQYISSVASGGISLTVTNNGQLAAALQLSSNANNAAVLDNLGKLYVPPVGNSFIQSKANSDSITLTVSQLGELLATLKLDTNSDNAISISPNGVFAKKLKIASNSSSLAEIDSNGDLVIKSARLTDIHSATAYTSISNFCNAYNSNTWNPNTGKELGTADLVILASSAGNYLYKGADNPSIISITDFIVIEGGEYTTAQIIAMFSGVGSISINTNGQISLNLSTANGNNLTTGVDGKLYHNTGNTQVQTVNNANQSQTLSVIDTFNQIFTVIKNLNTAAVAAENGLQVSAGKVILGGTLTKNTVIDQDGKSLTIEKGDVNIHNLFLAQFTTDSVTGLPTTRIGTLYYKVFLNENFQLVVVPL
jgi:hypothetical protein